MSPTEAGLYQCGRCKAEYNRADHLTRHIRVHMRQRPFVCSLCPKAFARQDLMKRHEAIHLAHSSSGIPRMSQTTDYGIAPVPRVIQACRRCASKKLKCTDEKPCGRCRQKELVCEYDEHGDIGFPERSSSLTTLESAPALSNTAIESAQSDAPLGQPAIHTKQVERGASDDTTVALNVLSSELSADLGPFSDHGYDEFLENTFNLETMDFTFLDQLVMMPSNESFSPDTDSSIISSVAIGSQVYRRPLLMGWVPSRDENSGTEYSHLALPAEVSGQMRPSRRLIQDVLSVAARDQILSMILDTSSRANRSRIISSFPSTSILTDLIQFAFLHMTEKQTNSFIHLPTFQISDENPELLGALIAAGAIYSPVQAVRNFGYAMQEAIRVAIQHRVSAMYNLPTVM
jgi:hypothetical protein